MEKTVFRIDSIAYGGDAVGRMADNMVCFVPGALPGELIEAAIVEKKRSFARGKLLRVLEASPQRQEPQCRYFVRPDDSGTLQIPGCPGCSYLNMPYSAELECKQEQFKSFLLRNNLVDAERILPPFASPERFFTRNKLKLKRTPTGSYGYSMRDNTTVMEISGCLLGSRKLNEAFAKLGDFSCPGVTLRDSFQKPVALFDSSDRECGARLISENIVGTALFQVPLNGFFQTNIPVAGELVRRVVECIKSAGVRSLLELYCGVGLFSISAAKQMEQLKCTGVEISGQAIECAKLNARNFGVAERCRFFAADAVKFLEKRRFAPVQAVLVDPPRAGMDKKVVEILGAMSCPLLIYISCAPDTLQRDLVRLREYGYTVQESGLLDMFPCTAHFESMTVLTKK